MTVEPRLDIIGAALADPSRSRILCEMMDGRAFTNKELACAAGISPQTASAHLKQLTVSGLTTSLRSGRSVYHRIANEQVASVLEALATLSPTDHLTRANGRTLPDESTMQARSCYNHIAGRLGVLLTQGLVARGILLLGGDTVTLGPDAETWAQGLGITLPKGPNPVVKLCLDWTERKHHIAGPFATAVMDHALRMQWLERQTGSRALTITTLGAQLFTDDFGVTGL